MTIEKVLKNGVEVYALTVEPDFDAVVEMFDNNNRLRQCDVWDAYENRVSNHFVGSYKVEVSSTTEYDRFINVLKNEVQAHKNQLQGDYFSKVREFETHIIKQYMRGLISDEQAQEFRSVANDRASQLTGCSCGLCSLTRYPTLEEWVTGKYQEGKRTMKLGKKLLKSGFLPRTLDYYSAQYKRDSKTMYFTISDLPQHIAGMTYYSTGDWSSCQDPRDEDSEYCVGLIGSLHDDKLFVGMLHESLDDLEDMDEKLVGRTMMRYLTIDGAPALVATTYYADSDDRGYVKSAVEQLSELDIYTKDCMFDDAIMEEVREPANGAYELIVTEEVHVKETIETDVDCECPACRDGRYEVMTNNGDWVKIDCPVCGGSGDYTAMVYADIDEWVDVETRDDILPYDEDYSHYGDTVSMNIRIEGIRRCRAERAGTEYLSQYERDAVEVAEMREVEYLDVSNDDIDNSDEVVLEDFEDELTWENLLR